MVEVINRKKALSVNPLKVSQPVGGALAFLGVRGAVPLMHGSQGCTAFAKVFFVRHFREPIPLQTTAMDQVSAVMGADESIIEALDTICRKSAPQVVGLVSTGLSEAQGCDLRGAVKRFRLRHPEFAETTIVALNTPDFSGCLETGYASAVLHLLQELVPVRASPAPVAESSVINVLASAMLTQGDLEELEEILEQFGLTPRIVPNVGESLGELTQVDFSAVTLGGTEVAEVRQMGNALATLVVGPSLYKSGQWLEKRTGVPSVYVPHLHTLTAVDQVVASLLELTGRDKPSERLLRQRRQLTDAMLDTHFSIGLRRIAVACDADLMLALTDMLCSLGAEVTAAVTPSRGEALSRLPLAQVQIGDLEDLEVLARESGAQLLYGNSHAVETAERLAIPLLRVGFPLYDSVGAFCKRWIGYRGVRHALYELANTLHHQGLDEVQPYRAHLSQRTVTELQAEALP